MISFELSAIDFILVIAVIVLFILYITRSSVKTSTEEKLSVGEGASPKKLATATSLEKEEKKRLLPQPQADSSKCPHVFGYLKKLDKDAPIPDECLSCSRIMECFGSNE